MAWPHEALVTRESGRGGLVPEGKDNAFEELCYQGKQRNGAMVRMGGKGPGEMVLCFAVEVGEIRTRLQADVQIQWRRDYRYWGWEVEPCPQAENKGWDSGLRGDLGLT